MYPRSILAAGAMLLAALGCRDDTGSPTEPVATTPQADASAATTLAFWQVSAGHDHTCGLTTDYRAYCWGVNLGGELGDGTTTGRRQPVAVATALRFRQISAGNSRTCGVTTNYRVYCWGNNIFGTLGDGTDQTRPTPVPVTGGHQFRSVRLGSYHTCAQSYPDNRAYCWGDNSWGQLGTGEVSNPRMTPVAVVGSLRFRDIAAGFHHTCGITTTNQAYCWGINERGQLGDGTRIRLRPYPAAIAGGRAYRQLDAGDQHTCALTTTDQAFCWGNGRSGQLGNGNAVVSFWPRKVSGGLLFHRVTAGGVHTCAETAANQAYCWGSNGAGALGDGTTTLRLTPVPIMGGLIFKQVSAGGYHTCGKTAAAVGYCWGYNYWGQLGDGTLTNRLRPKRIADPM
jgi:alpha-tubulin suppressor-like RCC1 family protein